MIQHWHLLVFIPNIYLYFMLNDIGKIVQRTTLVKIVRIKHSLTAFFSANSLGVAMFFLEPSLSIILRTVKFFKILRTVNFFSFRNHFFPLVNASPTL